MRHNQSAVQFFKDKKFYSNLFHAHEKNNNIVIQQLK